MEQRHERYTGEIPDAGEVVWVRLYRVAQQVKAGPYDEWLVRELVGCLSAKILNTGVWRIFSPQELKRTRAGLPDDEPETGSAPDLPTVIAPRGHVNMRPQ